MNLQKPAIDLGIIAKDIDAMLGFYRDYLGLEFVATIPMPLGGTMHRFRVGESVIKIIDLDPAPQAEAPLGGVRGANGYRYWTIHIDGLEGKVAALEAAGQEIVVPIREIREGVRIAFVVDPDGNWVELLENS